MTSTSAVSHAQTRLDRTWELRRLWISIETLGQSLFVGEIEGFRSRPVDPNHPQGTTQLAGDGNRATHLQPAEIFFVGLIGVDENVPITILCAGFAHRNFLMPAVLSADWIGLNGEGQVLGRPCIFPMDTRRIRIVALEGLNAVDRPHHPLSRLNLLQIDQRCRPAFTTKIFFQTPASEGMRASDNARRNP